MVTNTGAKAGDCVVTSFIAPDGPGGPKGMPNKRLVDFVRLKDLQPGEKRTVSFLTPGAALAYADPETGATALQPGAYRVEIGDVDDPAVHRFTLDGEAMILNENSWVKHL